MINGYNGFIHGYLVGGLEHGFLWLSHHIGNVIMIPIDELIFFRGVVQPPTSKYWVGYSRSR